MFLRPSQQPVSMHDNTGPSALEAIPRGHVSGTTLISGVGLKDLVATTCWYTSRIV